MSTILRTIRCQLQRPNSRTLRCCNPLTNVGVSYSYSIVGLLLQVCNQPPHRNGRLVVHRWQWRASPSCNRLRSPFQSRPEIPNPFMYRLFLSPCFMHAARALIYGRFRWLAKWRLCVCLFTSCPVDGEYGDASYVFSWLPQNLSKKFQRCLIYVLIPKYNLSLLSLDCIPENFPTYLTNFHCLPKKSGAQKNIYDVFFHTINLSDLLIPTHGQSWDWLVTPYLKIVINFPILIVC